MHGKEKKWNKKRGEFCNIITNKNMNDIQEFVKCQ